MVDRFNLIVVIRTSSWLLNNQNLKNRRESNWRQTVQPYPCESSICIPPIKAMWHDACRKSYQCCFSEFSSMNEFDTYQYLVIHVAQIISLPKNVIILRKPQRELAYSINGLQNMSICIRLDCCFENTVMITLLQLPTALWSHNSIMTIRNW